jgi:chemotaxis protein MotB
MTLLLVFFVFFFIINDFETGQMILKQNEELIESARLDSLLKLNEQTITIPGEVLFDSGYADLKQTSKRTLAKIADTIKQRIGNDSDWQIRIEGHTDNVPISAGKYASNWELSTARALIIVKFFMENNFFPPDQMQAMGYGEFKPLVDNDSSDNKMKNRRVEIKLSKKHN